MSNLFMVVGKRGLNFFSSTLNLSPHRSGPCKAIKKTVVSHFDFNKKSLAFTVALLYSPCLTYFLSLNSILSIFVYTKVSA